MEKKVIFFSNSPAMTLRLGNTIGERLKVGSIIALIGELGCGKTLLTRGICTGLEVNPRQVNSPTFVLVNEYAGRMPVFHMDIYRLDNIEQGIEIGMSDYLARAGSGVMIIEWAEKILDILPADRLEVRFDILSARKRRMELSAGGAGFRSLLKDIS